MTTCPRSALLTKTALGENRARLKGGILQADFVPRPLPQEKYAHVTGFGLHFYPRLPMLLQFPPEILKLILSYLEPIWLFQVEEAYAEIKELSLALNSVWYNSLPAALYLVPEHFQDEDKVNHKLVGPTGDLFKVSYLAVP